MRDVLTYLAGLVIVVLTAALALPPLIDWRAYREGIDGAIGRAMGLEARSDGRLELRLLPTPRLRMDHLRLASPGDDPLALDATLVKAEIELTPLLSGEIRFRDTRIGRAEFKLPVGTGGDWRVPRAVFDDAARRRAFVFEDLSVRQFLLTTFEPGTGRTDQLYAEEVRIFANSLTGPFRLDGEIGGERFELSTGQIASDLTAPVKIGAGGEGRPRIDFDGRVELRPGPGDALSPHWSGQARLVQAAPRSPVPDAPLPVTAQASVKASGRTVELESVSIEAGEGAGTLRLSGNGRYRVDEPLLSLALEGRRFNLAAFLAGLGETPGRRLAPLQSRQPATIDVGLKLDGVAIGGDDDLTGVRLDARLSGERLTVRRLDLAAPGQTQLQLSGDVSLAGFAGQGTLRVAARESDRLARYLAAVAPNPATPLLDGQPFELTTEATFSPPVLSLHNLRAVLGEANLSGLVRFTVPEAGSRGRLDAQLALRGLDLSRLPDGGFAFDAARRLDFGIALDARGIAYGASRSGRIAARFSTDGDAILVDGLEVSELAGAEAQLSGRIAPDGAGRIVGRMKAPRAAPLIDLFGRAWLGGGVRLLPEAVRAGAVDAGISLEREARGAQPVAAIRGVLEGTLAGGPARIAAVSTDRIQTIEARLATDRAGAWLGSDAPALAKPGNLELAGARDGAGRLVLRAKGVAAGLAFETTRPAALGPDDDRIDGAEVALSAPDIRALAGLLGEGAAPAGAAAMSLRVAFAREDAAHYRLDGRVGGIDLKGDIKAAGSDALEGSLSLSRLSLPWLASALSLQVPAGPGPGWPAGRFGALPERRLLGTLKVNAGSLDLGGLVGRDAAFVLASTPEGFGLRDLGFGLADGAVSRASLTLTRQGGLASLIGEGAVERLPLSLFTGAPFVAGRVSGHLRFGASGESTAGLLANLGGAGTAVLQGFKADGASPAGVERAASRALASDDPLASRNLTPLLARELDRGALAAERIEASLSLVGGTVRLTPLRINAPDGSWQGAATIDLRTRTIEARGALQAATAPRRWATGLPYITLGWEGPLAKPVRTIDPGPLVNGLASAVLQRELERIEIFELDAAERARLNARVDMDKKRREAIEEAARQARLREEAAERARVEAERRRVEAERAERAAAERGFGESGPPPRFGPDGSPIPSRPPPDLRAPLPPRPPATLPGG